ARAAGLALVLLANWVNSAVGLLLGPISLAGAALWPCRRAEFLRHAGLLACGLAFVLPLQCLAPVSSTTVRFPPPPAWWWLWQEMATAVAQTQVTWAWAGCLLLLCAAGAAWWAVPRLRGQAGEALRGLAAVAAGGLCYAALIALAIDPWPRYAI